MKKLLSLIFVLLVVALSLIALVGCQSAQEINAIVAIDEQGNEMQEGVVYDMPSSLVFTSLNYGPSNASPGGLSAKASIQLQATVYPDTASNKLVDWSIYWLNPDSEYSTGKDVMEYVNIIPLANGSHNATVECYRAFIGEIAIKVTTRDGGFNAVCLVKFEGVPLNLVLSPDSSYVEEANKIYRINAVSNNSIAIDLSNSFGVIGSKYNDFSYTLKGVGNMSISVPMDDDFDVSSKNIDGGSYPISWLVEERPNCLEVSFNGSFIIIKSNLRNISLFDRKYFYSDGQFADYGLAHFHDYVNSSSYFEIEVLENNSGVMGKLKIRTQEGVPTSMGFSHNCPNSEGKIIFTPNVNNTISVNLTNDFGIVDAKYNDFSYYITASGGFSVNVPDEWGGNDISSSNISGNDFELQWLLQDFDLFDVTFSGSDLILKPISLNNIRFRNRKYFYSDGQFADTGVGYFHDYKNANSYFILHVVEKNSGLEHSYPFRIMSDVQSVSVSDGTSSYVGTIIF